MTQGLFPMGSTFITPAALTACQSFPMPPDVLLFRHVSGDWREMGEEDERLNRLAIKEGERILSAYRYGTTKFYVITEADRAQTTILLADEY